MKSMAIVAAAATLFSSAKGNQFVMYTPGGDTDVVERIDPILNPGTISGHVHHVFGADGLSPDMDYDSLQKSTCTTVGDSHQNGNAQDKSVYWIPALYMEKTDGSGFIRVPTNGHKMYYRDVGNADDQKASPFEFPKGFRMVAGDKTMRAAATDVQRQNITQWICHDGTQYGNQGTDGGFPTGVSDCASYPYFAGSIHFPHCWNGKDFDLEDPTAHMSYPDGDIQGGPCPSSHPIRVPHIFQENFFDLSSVKDQVKPDTFTLSIGDPTGYGYHADMFNGWDEGAIPTLLASCPQGQWGNEDVATCTAFQKFSTSTSDCKLKTSYKENVDSPGKFLPGCNPVTTVNPAPKLAVAALGQSTDTCAAGGSSGSGSSGSSSSSSGDDSTAEATPPSYQAPTPTTLATYAANSPAAYATDVNVVYATEVVYVTARDAAPTPVAEGRRSRIKPRHQHHQHIAASF